MYVYMHWIACRLDYIAIVVQLISSVVRVSLRNSESKENYCIMQIFNKGNIDKLALRKNWWLKYWNTDKTVASTTLTKAS